MPVPGPLTLTLLLNLSAPNAWAAGGFETTSSEARNAVEVGEKVDLFAAADAAAKPSAGAAVEHVEARLGNGLRLIAIKDSTPGLVAVQTWISVGSGGEVAPGTSGYAHFFEHLMFHGTPTLSGKDREARLQAMGVEENAWTSQDETCYHLLGPAKYLDALLDIEADRFAHTVLSPEGVRREAGAVYGEFRKSETDPYDALIKNLWATAFTSHPYKHDTLGLESDIQAMPDGIERARAFRQRHYRPDQALVVVAGDIVPAVVIDKLKAAYGKWTVDGAGPSAVPAEPPQRRFRQTDVDWQGPPLNTKMAIGWRVPAFVPAQSNSAALEVVRELLMSRASLMVRRLVDEEKLVFQVYGAAPDHVDPGLLWMVLDLQAGVQPEAVLAEVDKAVSDLTTVSAGRVAVARARVQRQRTIALNGPEQRALAIGRMALHGDGFTAYARHSAAVGTVDAEAIKSAVRSYLTKERQTVVILGSSGAK